MHQRHYTITNRVLVRRWIVPLCLPSSFLFLVHLFCVVSLSLLHRHLSSDRALSRIPPPLQTDHAFVSYSPVLSRCLSPLLRDMPTLVAATARAVLLPPHALAPRRMLWTSCSRSLSVPLARALFATSHSSARRQLARASLAAPSLLIQPASPCATSFPFSPTH